MIDIREHGGNFGGGKYRKGSEISGLELDVAGPIFNPILRWGVNSNGYMSRRGSGNYYFIMDGAIYEIHKESKRVLKRAAISTTSINLIYHKISDKLFHFHQNGSYITMTVINPDTLVAIKSVSFSGGTGYFSVAIDTDGNVYVMTGLGNYQTSGTKYYYKYAVPSDGNFTQTWATNSNTSGSVFRKDSMFDNDGNWIICGYFSGTNYPQGVLKVNKLTGAVTSWSAPDGAGGSEKYVFFSNEDNHLYYLGANKRLIKHNLATNTQAWSVAYEQSFITGGVDTVVGFSIAGELYGKLLVFFQLNSTTFSPSRYVYFAGLIDKVTGNFEKMFINPSYDSTSIDHINTTTEELFVKAGTVGTGSDLAMFEIKPYVKII